jgi:hypothetical protein
MNDSTTVNAEELNTDRRELSSDELANASGGLAWIPIVVVGLFLAGIINKKFQLR